MKHKNELLKIICLQLNKEKTDICVSDFSELIEFAKDQSLLPYVSLFENGLDKNEKPDKKTIDYLTNVLLQASICSENQLFAVDIIQKECEKRGICTLAVKGAVTKKRYPDPILRSMSDIDILYRSQQHNAFKKAMFSLGYTDYAEGRKNDTYKMPPFISVEAHRNLLSNESCYYEYYLDVWNRCKLKKGCEYTYEMTLEDEFIFNIVHLAEHFKHGGVGIRFIIDIYIYDNLDFDRQYFENELRKLKLYDFYKNISALAQYWFANGECSELITRLSDLILSNGIFGDKENEAALYVRKGRFLFLLHTCFPKYEDMKSMFPWLNGKKYLLPYAWLLRGFNSIKYRRQNVKAQFVKMKTGDAKKGNELSAFYKECGLD